MPVTWPIAEYMNAAAVQCAVPRPASWVSATGTNETVMKALLQDTVRELVRRNDWKQLTNSQTIAGTGVESYALPADFLRLAAGDNAVYENSPNDRPCVPIYRDGDWTELKERNWAGVQRYFRLAGGSIDFFQPLPSGGSVTVAYVSRNWKRASDGTTVPGESWTAESDVALIPGHLIQLGVIWRFRRHQGLQYLDRKVEYEAELARAIADDRPVGKVGFDGSRGVPRNPFEVPIPDYIPPG
jgi:hypothetical protein